MLRKIRSIRDFGPYIGWGSGDRAEIFKRVNLIYGANGSGKSSLASLLLALSQASEPGVRISAEIEQNNAIATVDQHDGTFWGRVRVFNRTYVRSSLRFDAIAGPDADGLLVLGESSVAQQDELATIRARLEAIDGSLPELRDRRQATERSITRAVEGARDLVVSELHNVDRRYSATNIYRSTVVRGILADTRVALDGRSTDVQADLAVVTAEHRPARLFDPPDLEAGAGLSSLAAGLLERHVVVDAIAELAAEAHLARWVQDGIALHIDREGCAFCGSALSADRRAALAAHFDEGLRHLQSEVRSAIDRAEVLKRKAIEAASGLPTRVEVYSDLGDRLISETEVALSALTAYQHSLDEWTNALRSKERDPLSRPPLPSSSLDAPDLSGLHEVIAEHNARSAQHTQVVAAAARRVELYRIWEISDAYDEQSRYLGELADEISALESERMDLSTRRASLATADADPLPLANELTAGVTQLLGRGDLKFELAGDGRSYRITRDGNPAMGLSEGECTAISLLYFLASLRTADAPEAPIVVIDDPVSSLDQGILFGVSGFLWAELVNGLPSAQIFLLTHSFELFRQWGAQLDSVPDNGLAVGGYTVHELRMRFSSQEGGATHRRPTLEPWPSDRRTRTRLRSQYHFLFHQVADAVIESARGADLAHQLELLALAPNSARKMLEAFLSFRFPNALGNFTASMREALEGADQPLRIRVTRYLHAYSHNDEGDIGRPLEPGEATPILSAVFGLMNFLDAPHLEAMARAFEIDLSELIRPGASPL